jgi:starch synthase (maltosyl-transferring)
MATNGLELTLGGLVPRMTGEQNSVITPALSRRVAIENVQPQVNCGRFPIKRTLGDRVTVTADIFADGHDIVYAVLRHRPAAQPDWEEIPMEAQPNDRWQAEFTVPAQGRHLYTLQAWLDHFQSWSRDLEKKFTAAQDISVDILSGIQMIKAAVARAGPKDKVRLTTAAEEITKLAATDPPKAVEKSSSPELKALMIRNADRRRATTYGRELEVIVDRQKARFSAWYEMFPRSSSPQPGRHGTLQDTINRLGYVAGMGFDVLYLPPIHPIGRVNRKGKKAATRPLIRNLERSRISNNW